jgi:hypothetical protein
VASSSIPTLKQNLVTLLAARPALNGVQVSYGPPLPNPGREFVWCGKATGDQSWMTVGGTKLEEYDQQVLISVLREGVDMHAADARCFVLFAELEALLRADQTVTGAVAVAAVEGFELGEGVAPDGTSRESTLTVQVACQAYI